MKTKHHIINSGSNGFDMQYPENAEQDILHVAHNAGFFSCCSIALQDIVVYSRNKGKLPDVVDRHSQYSWYKHEPTQSLIGHFFEESNIDIDFREWFELGDTDKELQYTNYHNLNFDKLIQLRDRYFKPSQYILDKVKHLEEKYSIDYDNTCGVLYRGNDKNRECKVASYEDFYREIGFCDSYCENLIDKNIRILVAPDETEFLDDISIMFKDKVLCMEETAHMPKKDSCIPLELPLSERAEQAANFFATVIMLSKCEYLITHSGNVSLWACIYRGNMIGVSQWNNGQWI